MRLPYVISVAATIVVAVLWATPPAAQERPLPDRDRFLAEVRARLQTDSSLQSSYIYTETRREQKLDGRGRVRGESVTVLESYPGLPGEERWERMISENGRARDPADLEKEMRDRQKQAERLVREASARPARVQARQQREYAEQRREFDAVLDDLFLVYDIRMDRRELLDGHETIAFSLTPRADAKPRTREGRQMQKVAVRAWVSESDRELVGIDATVVDTLSIGFGLFARLHKGALLSFRRTKVNGEVWLPSRVSYSGSARVGLIAVLRRRGISEFSNYRKFSVDTSTTYQSPPP